MAFQVFLPVLSQMPRTAYLDHGSHDLSGFLIEPLSVPLGVQAPEICGQPVVLPHKERVHGGELRHLTRTGVPLGKQKLLSFLRPPSQKGLAPLELPPGPRPQTLLIATQLFTPSSVCTPSRRRPLIARSTITAPQRWPEILIY